MVDLNEEKTRGNAELPIGMLLRFLYSSLAEEEEQQMAAAGYDDIHIAHFPVLKFLFVAGEAVRITDLAARARITKPSMVYLVNHLEEQGYVERGPNAADKRAQLVRLTTRGQEATERLHSINSQIEQRWEEQFGFSVVSQLRHFLQSLVFQHEGASQSTANASIQSEKAEFHRRWD